MLTVRASEFYRSRLFPVGERPANVLRDHAVRHLRHPRPGGGNGRRLGPCLHSFRHGFAVGRLNAWFRQGADVQRLLPVLSNQPRPQEPDRNPSLGERVSGVSAPGVALL